MRNRQERDERRRHAVAAVLSRHPREAVGIVMAVAVSAAIFVNALFLQKGPHPAPMFAPKLATLNKIMPPSPVQHTIPPTSLLTPVPTPTVASHARLPAKTHAEVKGEALPEGRNDPIAELLLPSRRVMVVQQALSDFGYGQVKPTGEFGPETREAIEKFERSRKMPVTGQISDALVRALSAMTGRPLE